MASTETDVPESGPRPDSTLVPPPDPKLGAQVQRERELEKNDLAKALDSAGKKLQESRVTGPVAAGIIALTVVIAVLFVMAQQRSRRLADAWNAMASADNPEAFELVATDYAGTAVEPWARVNAAREFLNEGIQSSLTDKPASLEKIKGAAAEFEALLASDVPAEVAVQSQLGLAVALESISDGSEESMQAAIAAYEKLLTLDDGKHKAQAEDRIAALKNPRTAEFYKWFSAQEIAPPSRPAPNDPLGLGLDGLQTDPSELLGGSGDVGGLGLPGLGDVGEAPVVSPVDGDGTAPEEMASEEMAGEETADDAAAENTATEGESDDASTE